MGVIKMAAAVKSEGSEERNGEIMAYNQRKMANNGISV